MFQQKRKITRRQLPFNDNLAKSRQQPPNHLPFHDKNRYAKNMLNKITGSTR
jgi:hypothetical protein